MMIMMIIIILIIIIISYTGLPFFGGQDSVVGIATR
jgi:hypothetical protein